MEAQFCSGVAAISEHKFLFLSTSVLSASQHIYPWRWHREIAVKSANKVMIKAFFYFRKNVFSLAKNMGFFYCVLNRTNMY